MAGISLDFRNIVGSKKCAVSSPRIVSLEIGEESPGNASESVFQGILNERECRNDVKNNSICKLDKQSDKNFLIHSQSTLSATCNTDLPSDKIKSTNDSDIDLDLLDLLNSADLKRAAESGAGNFNSKNTTSHDKMKIISNVEVCDSLSDLLSSIAHGNSEKNEGGLHFENCQIKNTWGGDICPNYKIVENGCANPLSSNNSSLKVEGDLSDLLSFINIEDSDVIKIGSCNSRNMCNSSITNKSVTENEQPFADLSDLLSSIDLGDSNDNKVDDYNQGSVKVLESENESCLADLLSSIDIDKSKKPVSAILDSNQDDICKMKVLEVKNEQCVSDLLSSVDIGKPISTTLNNEPLSFGNSNLYFKDTNGISDSLNDFTFDIGFSSSNNSCASSCSEKESNSPKNSSPQNNLLAGKLFAFDSGYSSFDSADNKGFSFFDYSSDNQFSFNTLLNEKSVASTDVKHSDNENARNNCEEMSMSELMTIVSPEFKNSVLATINKTKELKGNVSEDSLSMLDLMEDLNMNGSHAKHNNSIECDEKMMSYDCNDGKISKNVQSGMETLNSVSSTLVGKDDIMIDRSNFVNDHEQITFIDLRECVKSAQHQFTHTSPIKQHESVKNQSSECLSPIKVLFYCEDKSPSDSSQNKSNPFEIDEVLRKKLRVNTKQTLFSKALACKPKKNHSILQKVVSIKNELLNNILHRPVFIDCDLPEPLVESVLQSDRCIFSNVRRMSFGPDAPCELQ